MAENKTKPQTMDFATFAASVEPAKRREEALILDEIFRAATGFEPVLWGPSIVGYGRYHYRYDSGREAESLAAGFSPRKDAVSLYIPGAQSDAGDILADLGPHTTGKSCIYVKDLAKIDRAVLARLIRAGLDGLAAKWSVFPR